MRKDRRPMSILVTGHRGYIGTALVPLLAAAGHQVRGLDSGLFEACTFGDPPVEVPGQRMDIRDVEVRDLAGINAVVHLAGLSNDPLGDLDPVLTTEINHHASVRLAEVARAAGVRRFVFSSSCSVYGAAGSDTVDEETPARPVTAYGRSKAMVEEDVARLADGDFSPTFLRNATAYGVSPRLRFDLVLNNLVAWAAATGRVQLKSDGHPWRPLVHIEDIGRAFLAVLEAEPALVHNRVFNVGSTSENYRIRELAEIVQETVPGSTVTLASGGGADSRSYRVDCGRFAAAFPDALPRWTARRGARELYDVYREAGITVDDFEGPRFMRVAHIRWLLAAGELDSSLRWRSRPAAKAAEAGGS